ncbi:extracellular solute-binding protein [Streptomyces oceani]|uniref:Sugar ABC transporter substrate-binding protein n=1 Tax=Streptomyces oceani TaxID=1075402 RepID=A0A1E7KPH3_9ACTN|nr:extracellular solute-binding protein [Streptomyces oceani]OEV05796.1 sugar ABC transporter substrate-binding protein [Streptomyces oceani]
MRAIVPLTLTVAAALAVGTLTGCGTTDDPDVIEVAFQKDTNNQVTVREDYVEYVAKQFEKAYPGKEVKPVPIQASQDDYYTKIQVMMRSPNTAPDVVYEDSFLIRSDIEAGYLQPLDRYLEDWDDWSEYQDAAKEATQGPNGGTYGVPDGTDTRGLWYNKKIFEKAGLPTDWKPRTWDDVLKTARTIKKRVPEVIPFNVFTGKAAGEAAAMQGFEMLLYGTEDPLYDKQREKWIIGSEGFEDSLRFVESVYSEKLGPPVSEALSPNIQTQVPTEYLPEGKLAIALDGSFLSQQWLKTGGKPWPEWSETMGVTPMPTQHGAAPGKVSMSGGWAWSIPEHSGNPDLAWKLIETMQTPKNAREWYLRGSQISVRDDVSEDPEYQKSLPRTEFFTDLVDVSHYRPALPVYPQVSTAITEAMEQVTTGDSSPREAAAAYDKQVRSITDGAVTKR